jgi:flagellar assembly factor FliW
MIIKTLRFGELEVDETTIITFTKGPLGFDQYKKWVLVENGLLGWLQSIENEELAFVVGNPFEFYHDYNFEVSEAEIKELQILSAEEISVLSIVSVPPRAEEMTINLIAPIVINSKSKEAKQVILNNNSYNVRHYVYTDLIANMKKKEAMKA